MLRDFSHCEVVELWLKEGDSCSRCQAKRHPKQSFRLDITPWVQDREGLFVPSSRGHVDLEQLCWDIVHGRADRSLPFFTRNGSFWTGDTESSLGLNPQKDMEEGREDICSGRGHRSLVLIPIGIGNKPIGLLQLRGKPRDYFTQEDVEFYEDIAQILQAALVNQRAQAALRERIKELTCLYGIAKVAERPGTSLEETLRRIVELLPPGWQYPEITGGRIVVDGEAYSTAGFKEGDKKQVADIVVNRQRRGFVEVIYMEEKPQLDEGPFLKEERSLLNAVARQVGLIIEQRQAGEQKSKLEDQLRHAERLATIGQLSAGVAHELNEPLGNVLGFAQLVKKCPGLPDQTRDDVEKIIAASMHAREIIRKLMLFSRQKPSRRTRVNLNQLIREGVYLLEARCAKEGIDLVLSLSDNLPEIAADPAQLHQVLVNLAVNGIQAMPEGGKLTVRTISCDGGIALIVEDTGVGMSEDVLDKIFIPFFSTKDVDHGTGLGLSVVHGIVTSHGGSINVESEVGCGTQFEIRLPVKRTEDAKESCQDVTFD